SPEAYLGEKPGYYPPFHPILKKAPLVKFIPQERKEISPLPFSHPSFSTSPGGYEELISSLRHPFAAETAQMSYRGEKGMTQPPSQIPLKEKIPPAPEKEKVSPPYLSLSAYIGGNNNFGYQLNYGRKEKEKKNIYFFTLKRDFTSHYVNYKKDSSSEFLSKEGDEAKLDLGWDLSEEREFSLSLEGAQKKIALPGDKEENKNTLGIKGDWKFQRERNTFKIKGWAEKGGINEGKGTDYGAQVEMEMRGTPLTLGISGDWKNIHNGSSTRKSQSHLWISDKAIPTGEIKGLSISARIGVKGIEDKGEFLPYLKVAYQANPQMRVKVVGEKEFYLSKFSDLYIANDYVKVNPLLGPSNFWNYKIGLEYKVSPQMDASFEAFYKEGEDLIWNEDDAELPVEPINADILLRGGQLRLLHRFGENFEQELIYTHQEAKNTAHPGKVVPYLPQNSGKLLLRWSQNDWQIEAGGEIIGERYCNEDTTEKLSSGWKGRLKVSKKIGKRIEGFAQLELNDYQLWKNYHLPDNKYILGIEAKF
ncbi:MAG: TonB-dependent receptor, partial [Candidatus Aerophobetes bacterium]|nr:TonB-dependent receptor [Candidatus Aerophobetes bacterium]